MLKKKSLAIVIATTILVPTIAIASETKDDNNHSQKSISANVDKNDLLKVRKSVDENEYLNTTRKKQGDIEITKTFPSYKKNEYGNVYSLSLTTITFRVNDGTSSATEDFLKLDNELKNSKNIEEAFSKYGKIFKVENKIQSVVAGYNNSVINTKTIEYASEVTNGVQSRDYLDIINYQNVYINDKLSDNRLAVFMDIKDSQLDALEKFDVGTGSTKSYIESPNVSSYAMDQTVVLKAGEYKLVNLTNTTADPDPLFKNLPNRVYRAVIVKVLDQGT